jgi:hypothetical protein
MATRLSQGAQDFGRPLSWLVVFACPDACLTTTAFTS